MPRPNRSFKTIAPKQADSPIFPLPARETATSVFVCIRVSHVSHLGVCRQVIIMLLCLLENQSPRLLEMASTVTPNIPLLIPNILPNVSTTATTSPAIRLIHKTAEMSATADKAARKIAIGPLEESWRCLVIRKRRREERMPKIKTRA